MSNYRTDTARLAAAFKALSNPNRLNIFSRLLLCCASGSACQVDQCMKIVVGELGKDMDIAASTLSHHLKALHQAGLISMQRRGQHVDCWVNAEMVEQLSFFLNISKN
ncbi:MAG: helix-turn-helix domain-containing protein [Gammaproteobacteria bacterium]|nr:helix-turn-helix domain-containing protein [Gammaproteobacteria bacterium]